MHGVTDIFDRSYQATPESIGQARAEVASFAAEHGVAPRRIDDIRLAVSEAFTNAVMHGYRGAPGAVHVSAELGDGTLWLSVRDFGRGMQPKPIAAARSGMGLGLSLIGRFVGELTVAPRPGGGTEVRMRFDRVAGDVPDDRRVMVA